MKNKLRYKNPWQKSLAKERRHCRAIYSPEYYDYTHKCNPAKIVFDHPDFFCGSSRALRQSF